MRKKLRIGIAYDVKEDYNINSASFKHCDFSTLAEMKEIKELLEERDHIVYFLGNYEQINKMLINQTFPAIDILMNTAEGINSRNREGWIPSLCEVNNIPYSGSDAYALGLTLNKLHTKIIAEYLNIPTPSYCSIDSLEDIEKVLQLKAPWILKPNYEGSSSGITLVEESENLQPSLELLFREYRQSILCETYISGREFTVSLLYDGSNTKVIGTVETIRKNGHEIGIFSAQDKHTDTCAKIPVDLPEKIIENIENDSKKLYNFLGCFDYARADFRIDSNNQHYLLELTPLPSIDSNSAFAKCCEYNKLKFGKVLEEILYNALKRYNSQP